MKIFDIIDHTVVVSPEILTIKCFKDIWELDKSKLKENAYRDFTYIYHMCDYNSPYSNYPSNERTNSVKEEVLGDKKYTPSKEVNVAIEQYKKLIESPLTRLLEASKKRIDDIVDYFNGNTVEDISEAKISGDILKNIGATAASFKNLEDEVRKTRENSGGKNRGNVHVNSEFSE